MRKAFSFQDVITVMVIYRGWGGVRLMDKKQKLHYSDVIIGAMASQIPSLAIVFSTVYSGADQRKHQSSASLAFVRGMVNSTHKWPVTRKMFSFDDVIIDMQFLTPMQEYKCIFLEMPLVFVSTMCINSMTNLIDILFMHMVAKNATGIYRYYSHKECILYDMHYRQKYGIIAQWKYRHLTFWFAGLGLAPTTNKYNDVIQLSRVVLWTKNAKCSIKNQIYTIEYTGMYDFL